MQQCPGGFVAPQPQHALDAKGADAVLLAGELRDGAEPDRQGKKAVLENVNGFLWMTTLSSLKL